MNGHARGMATCRVLMMFFRPTGVSIDLLLDAKGVGLFRPVTTGAIQTGIIALVCEYSKSGQVGPLPFLADAIVLRMGHPRRHLPSGEVKANDPAPTDRAGMEQRGSL